MVSPADDAWVSVSGKQVEADEQEIQQVVQRLKPARNRLSNVVCGDEGSEHS